MLKSILEIIIKNKEIINLIAGDEFYSADMELSNIIKRTQEVKVFAVIRVLNMGIKLSLGNNQIEEI